MGFLPVAASRGCPLVVVCRLLVVVASLVAQHRLWGRWASIVVACRLSSYNSQALEHRLSSCGAWAQLLCNMWDLPAPGIEPVSLALTGGFSTTDPPGKSLNSLFIL